ncbi:hypothetical protein AB0J01_37995 [Streptomyces sp. NPDC050204]|uniref:hypothetical protein n=1 Tax=Streptomyces sp. NPDC050204 TaxID=3155514 RepID=UPI0034478BD6
MCTAADIHAWCFDHGRAHTFKGGKEPWCGAAWVTFAATSTEEALAAKQAAYGDAQFFDQLSATDQLDIIEIRSTRPEAPAPQQT